MPLAFLCILCVSVVNIFVLVFSGNFAPQQPQQTRLAAAALAEIRPPLLTRKNENRPFRFRRFSRFSPQIGAEMANFSHAENHFSIIILIIIVSCVTN